MDDATNATPDGAWWHAVTTRRRRPWGRWTVYTIIGVTLAGSTLLMGDTVVARWAAARWDAELGDVASESGSSDPRDVMTCVRITEIAQRYQAGELTDRGYTSALAEAIDAAARGGDVARYAEQSLEAFRVGDAAAGERARAGLADACATAAG